MYPALHKQTADAVLPVGDIEWGGHMFVCKCIFNSVLVPHGVKTLLVSWYTQQ